MKKWILVFICLAISIAVESLMLAGNSYGVFSAFNGDILNARYRQELIKDLDKGNYFGVVLTDYEFSKQQERLKALDPYNELTITELERYFERILITFADELYKKGFDVALEGEGGLSFAERGLVSFALFDNKIYYSKRLIYNLPIEYLPHLNWYQTFDREVAFLKEDCEKNESKNPLFKVSLLALDSLSQDDPTKDIEGIRVSLEKANLKGSPLDRNWERLEEISLRIKRQKLGY